MRAAIPTLHTGCAGTPVGRQTFPEGVERDLFRFPRP